MKSRLFEAQPKYGFCNERGEIIVSPRFDEAKSNEYFNVFKVGNYWGFINNEGNCVIEAQFDDVDFYDDKAIVTKDDKKGLYSSKLEVILEVKCEGIFFINGFIIYKDDIGLHIKKEFASSKIYANKVAIDSDEFCIEGGIAKKDMLRKYINDFFSLNSNKKYVSVFINCEYENDFLAVFSEEGECYIQIIEKNIYDIVLNYKDGNLTMLVERDSGEYKFYYLEGDISPESKFIRIFEDIKVKGYEESGKYIVLIDENNIFHLFDRPNHLIFKGKKNKMKKEVQKRNYGFLIEWFIR